MSISLQEHRESLSTSVKTAELNFCMCSLSFRPTNFSVMPQSRRLMPQEISFFLTLLYMVRNVLHIVFMTRL